MLIFDKVEKSPILSTKHHPFSQQLVNIPLCIINYSIMLKSSSVYRAFHACGDFIYKQRFCISITTNAFSPPAWFLLWRTPPVISEQCACRQKHGLFLFRLYIFRLAESLLGSRSHHRHAVPFLFHLLLQHTRRIGKPYIHRNCIYALLISYRPDMFKKPSDSHPTPCNNNPAHRACFAAEPEPCFPVFSWTQGNRAKFPICDSYSILL